MAARLPQDPEKNGENQRFLSPNYPVNGTNNNSGIALPAIVAPKASLPPAIAILRRLIAPLRRADIRFYQFFILGITYFLYVCYHISRKPFSVVKPVLYHKNVNCTELVNKSTRPILPGEEYTWCNWKPFENGETATQLFGTLDFTYLMAYAIAMFFVGAVAERCNLRYFLTVGMLAAGFLTVLFGMAYIWEIHHFSFFVGVMLIGGALQATGFPAVVALVGNWFGRKRRGLIFGFWNSHASLGNILGSLLAAIWVDTNWSISFFVPALVIIIGGIIAFLFVIVQPEDAGFPPQNVPEPEPNQPLPIVINKQGDHELHQFLPKDSAIQIQSINPVIVEDTPLKFWQAFLIPGVIEYSICMFFAKGVAYTFLMWLPTYIKELMQVESSKAGYLSTAFDLGGIVGGIMVGAISDMTGARGLLSGVLMFLAVPVLCLLQFFGHYSTAVMVILLIASGLITVGPYSIIATAVAADLGTSLKGKSKAVASVSGIINGMGSFGAAFGPGIASFITARWGWRAVIWFLIIAQGVASLCLVRLIYRELVRMAQNRRQRRP